MRKRTTTKEKKRRRRRRRRKRRGGEFKGKQREKKGSSVFPEWRSTQYDDDASTHLLSSFQVLS